MNNTGLGSFVTDSDDFFQFHSLPPKEWRHKFPAVVVTRCGKPTNGNWNPLCLFNPARRTRASVRGIRREKTMRILIILNEPPYGNERSYNGLRLAGSLVRQNDTQLKVFLIGDAVICAKAGQKVPQGFYNIQLMLTTVLRHGGVIGCCGSCLDARGIGNEELTEGIRRSSMEELTAWTLETHKVISF
jgi:uncharacterized protein involved in oxidation of intracellular sulfur